MAELVGDLSGAQTSHVQEGGGGLPEDVTGGPLEAGVGECVQERWPDARMEETGPLR
jgi:hypothetical protein